MKRADWERRGYSGASTGQFFTGLWLLALGLGGWAVMLWRALGGGA